MQCSTKFKYNTRLSSCDILKESSIHGYEKSFAREIDKLKDSNLPQPVMKTILEYMDDLQLQGTRGLSAGRKYAYLLRLRKVALIIPDSFLNPSVKDIKKVMTIIQKTPVKWGSGEPHTPSVNQIQAYQVCIKKFYKWLLGNNKNYPECVEWIRITNPRNLQDKPVEIVSPKEHKLMIENARNPRDRALLSLLYDSGCRIGELLTLRIKDLMFDEYGALIAVTGKTGYRKVRIVGNSIAELQTWLDYHPERSNRDASLYCQIDGERRGESMQYDQVHSVFTKTAKRAGIKRRIYPHLYRHTRSTILASKVPEAVLESQQGWVHGSRMSRVYVHLTQEQQDEAILQANGIKKKVALEIETESPIVCPRCGTLNTNDAKYCRKCWLPLAIEAVIELKEKQDHIEHSLLNGGKISSEIKTLLDLMPETEKTGILASIVELVLKQKEEKGEE